MWFSSRHRPASAGQARQGGFLTSRQAIVLLALIFLAPTFVALVMHNVSDGGWQPDETTNSGALVHPARPLSLSPDIVHGEQPLADYLQGKWTLVYLGSADCDDVCKGNLYKMRQARTAQNEHMKRVQRLFVYEGGPLPEEVADYLASEQPQLDRVQLSPSQFANLVEFFNIDDTKVRDAGRVYIVDPFGNLMMYYPPDADPRGLLKDLKKLLKYSRIG
jgi:cytochrome oxidase Cu insertion factor (SCO1/SenC/PrrC family)